MAKDKLADFSLTFGDNLDVLGQSTAGSANANTIDTIFQKLMVVLGLFYDEIGGTGAVGGTANAITLATNATYPFQALASGLVCAFKAGSANTGATTINVDSLGAKAIRRQGDSALSAGDIVANGVYMLRYDEAYNAAAGAWVLLNPTVSGSLSAATTTNVLTGTDATAYATSDAIAALWEKGSDIASASTIALGEGGFFHVTGTTTITDIDWTTPRDGRGAWVIFDGALTLTHNATTLKLPTAANITTAAGDRAYFVQDSGDNVVCLLYQRADGAPLGSGGVGDSQAWQDVSGSRTWATSYQNTTGKPIEVAVRYSTGSATSMQLQVSANNSTWFDVGAASSANAQQGSAIVPNGHYYRLHNSVGTTSRSITYWSELR